MGTVLWRNYDEEALNKQLNLRALTPEHPRFFERWEADSRAVHESLKHRFDVAYGPAPGEKLDFFPSEDRQSPLLVFVHGGYWQGLDKAHYSYLAPAFVEQGIAFASVNYSLAPQARIGTMVEQVRRCLTWLYDHASDLGFARNRITVSGHSAGGHLAAMASATDWSVLGYPQDLLTGCCSVSGIYQLEPIRHSYHQPILQLTQEEAADLSPQGKQPSPELPIILGVGSQEPDEFRQQQRELAAAWGLHNPVKALEVPERHHFNVVDALIEDDQPLRQALLSLLRDGRLP